MAVTYCKVLVESTFDSFKIGFKDIKADVKHYFLYNSDI